LKSKYYKNKVAVITGGASGIGKAFAITLAKMGTNLVISDINLERLEETKKEIEKFKVRVVTIVCDVTKQLAVKKLVKTAIEEMGKIHFIFSNAGIAIGGHFETLSNSQWKRIINVNIYGNINVVEGFIPKLLEQGFGHIIVTGSIASNIGIGGLGPYNTTKFANAGFCESLFGEYHHRGIDVSLICPFPLQTNLIESAGIGIPSELLDGIDLQAMKIGIEEGKKYYWTQFTKKQSVLKGYAGGFTVERAVKRYLKKIRKKKLYIFERRYGRMLQFLKGFWPRAYKKFIGAMGKRHVELLNTTIKLSLEKAKSNNATNYIKNEK